MKAGKSPLSSTRHQGAVILSLGTSLSCAISSSQATTREPRCWRRVAPPAPQDLSKDQRKKCPFSKGDISQTDEVWLHHTTSRCEQPSWAAVSRTRAITGTSVEGHTIRAYGRPVFSREPRIWVTEQDAIGPPGNKIPASCLQKNSLWSLLHSRVNLIRDKRKCKKKEKQSSKTK